MVPGLDARSPVEPEGAAPDANEDPPDGSEETPLDDPVDDPADPRIDPADGPPASWEAGVSGDATIGDGGVIVLDALSFSGDAGPDVLDSLRAATSRGLQGGGATVRSAEAERTPCVDAACTTALARDHDAGRVLSGGFEVVERDYEITLRLHDGEDGHVLATVEKTCAICSVPDAEAMVEAATTELLAAIPEPESEPEPAPLVLRSDPPGARVYVDGVLVGTAPLERLLEPGDHLVEVQHDGYISYSQFVSIDPERAPEPLTIALAEEPSRVPFSALGWTAVSLGAGSIVAGAVLLALDEQPYKAQCDGADIDPLGRCRFQYNTLTGGVVSLVVGAALVGGGAALLVLGKRRAPERDAKGRARASLRLRVGARGVALAGRF
ncbi:MAG: PEGA domain-containing protein [Myxococcales bacterium]|nr:PEGA domain-containing protein [Myxococcales bacterium]